MKYRFLEHTADIKFLASGKTLEEAFEYSVLALKEVMTKGIRIKPITKKKISVSGKDNESLLYNFLEEFLFLLDAKGFILSKITKIDIDKKKFKLKAELLGDKAKNYKFSNDVKAVTYNDMFVRFDKKKKLWKTQVVLDV